MDLDDPRQDAASTPGWTVAVAYDTFAVGLFRYALMILADRQGAEDAVQQAFAKLLSAPDRARRIESLEAYLRTAVRNECYSLLRRRRREPASDGDSLLEIADPTVGSEPDRLALEAALRTLPPEQREVVFLKVYDGRSLREIGEALGESANTIASRYRYAMEKLRRLLQPGEGEA